MAVRMLPGIGTPFRVAGRKRQRCTARRAELVERRIAGGVDDLHPHHLARLRDPQQHGDHALLAALPVGQRVFRLRVAHAFEQAGRRHGGADRDAAALRFGLRSRAGSALAAAPRAPPPPAMAGRGGRGAAATRRRGRRGRRKRQVGRRSGSPPAEAAAALPRAQALPRASAPAAAAAARAAGGGVALRRRPARARPAAGPSAALRRSPPRRLPGRAPRRPRRRRSPPACPATRSRRPVSCAASGNGVARCSAMSARTAPPCSRQEASADGTSTRGRRLDASAVTAPARPGASPCLPARRGW